VLRDNSNLVGRGEFLLDLLPVWVLCHKPETPSPLARLDINMLQLHHRLGIRRGLFWLFRVAPLIIYQRALLEPHIMLRMWTKQIALTCCVWCLHFERHNTQQDIFPYLRSWFQKLKKPYALHNQSLKNSFVLDLSASTFEGRLA
jgi:hypothetical protein